LGELAGCILATARWPALARWGVPLDRLQLHWQREVMAQFAEDGGNKEQALNYHLFAWELCWQARAALASAGRTIDPNAEARLARALRFFWEVQARRQPWDYGDSDDAWVTPFFTTDTTRVSEWRNWAAEYSPSPSLSYWLGRAPVMTPRLGNGLPAHTAAAADWWIYPQSGLALHESGFWWLRWDLSPLGYLAPAAHGHLDVLHLSIWYRGEPFIVDPGTGAYYADLRLREWLASREAHNGPCSPGPGQPRRLGAFLWSRNHPAANWAQRGSRTLEARCLGFIRSVTRSEDPEGWLVEDQFAPGIDPDPGFTVRWQFAPGSWVKRISERKISVHRADVAVVIEVDDNWAGIELVELVPDKPSILRPKSAESLEGIVSPAFRRTAWAPYLKLSARPAGDKPCVFRTTFLACAP
jgi:hypothetical protein